MKSSLRASRHAGWNCYTADVPTPDPISIVAIDVEPLSIPLREPFVIATGRIDTTRAALVRATLEDGRAAARDRARRGAALPPVTREDQPELLAADRRGGARAARRGHRGRRPRRRSSRGAAARQRVARAGVEAAILDARARLAGVPLHAALGPAATRDRARHRHHAADLRSRTDVGRRARHRRAGFTLLQGEGRPRLAGRPRVAARGRRRGARTRASASTPTPASPRATRWRCSTRRSRDGLTIECFEQPCAADDLAGMAEVAARSPVPVVADESFRGADDLDRIIDARAAQAVNLKLAKLGGPLAALALARRARAAGLRLMAGAMVETRVGLLAMAHVVAALGGVDWVDLDTAFLLADDPFDGGWTFDGPRLRLSADAGTGRHRPVKSGFTPRGGACGRRPSSRGPCAASRARSCSPTGSRAAAPSGRPPPPSARWDRSRPAAASRPCP